MELELETWFTWVSFAGDSAGDDDGYESAGRGGRGLGDAWVGR